MNRNESIKYRQSIATKYNTKIANMMKLNQSSSTGVRLKESSLIFTSSTFHFLTHIKLNENEKSKSKKSGRLKMSLALELV